VRIEEFVSPDSVPLVAEAMERVFDRLGDRANKNRARLRFVVRRLGAEEFVAEYRREKAALQSEGLGVPVVAARPLPAAVAGDGAQTSTPLAAPPGCLPERDPERVTVLLQLRNGRLPAADLRTVATMANSFGVGVVVTTQQQDLLLVGVERTRIAEAQAALDTLSVRVQPRTPKIVACAGASTCKLGMCLSPALAQAVETRLTDVDTRRGPTSIRISGCPNSCGNHTIAALGLEGRARRSQGRLLPLYEVLWGGRVGENQVRFADRVGSVPARVVPELLAEVYRRGIANTDDVRALVAEFARLPNPVPEEYYVDVGDTKPFSLDGRGPGECGAGVLDVVRADLDETTAALALAEQSTGSVQDQALARAVLASARALLPLVGRDNGKNGRSIADAFSAVRTHLIEPGWLSHSVGQLLTTIEAWLAHPNEGLGEHLPATRDFAIRTRELFASLDANLQFQAKRVSSAASE
jgi:sulfite reductase (ferredoxin)